MGSVHELEALLVKWYPVSRRCVKYIVSVSEDGENYTEVLDYSDNVTLYDTVTDDLQGCLEGMSGLKYWATTGRPTRQETDSLSFRDRGIWYGKAGT